MNANFLKTTFILFVCLALKASFGYGSFDRDPVKDTQTNPVAVTQELLTRDSETGPASPTFKMSDTSGFLVMKPYDLIPNQNFLEENSIEESGFDGDYWNDWFETETSGEKSTEALEEKELK